MNARIDKFWKTAGEIRKFNLDVLEDCEVRLTLEEVLGETVNAVLDATIVERIGSRGDAEFVDFLHDIREECVNSPYLRFGGVERSV